MKSDVPCLQLVDSVIEEEHSFELEQSQNKSAQKKQVKQDKQKVPHNKFVEEQCETEEVDQEKGQKKEEDDVILFVE